MTPDSLEHADICAVAFSNTDPKAFFFLFEWIIHILAQKGNTAWVGMFIVGENRSTILCGIYIEEAPIVPTIPPAVETGELQKKCWLCSRIRECGGRESETGSCFPSQFRRNNKSTWRERATSLITIVNKTHQCQAVDEASGKTMLAAGFYLRGI